jgi:hypothetical protein
MTSLLAKWNVNVDASHCSYGALGAVGCCLLAFYSKKIGSMLAQEFIPMDDHPVRCRHSFGGYNQEQCIA